MPLFPVRKNNAMIRLASIAILTALFSAAASYADVPLPKDLKYVDPRVSFEGVEKQADHVFYVRFLTFTGGPGKTPYRVMEVNDAKPFNLKAERRLINMSLLAMDRKEFDKRKNEDPSLKWLTDKTAGVTAASFNAPSTVGKVSQTEVPVTTYRVTLKDGKLTAELVKDAKRGDATPGGLLPVWAFGLVGALSLAGLGMWAARRRRAHAV